MWCLSAVEIHRPAFQEMPTHLIRNHCVNRCPLIVLKGSLMCVFAIFADVVSISGGSKCLYIFVAAVEGLDDVGYLLCGRSLTYAVSQICVHCTQFYPEDRPDTKLLIKQLKELEKKLPDDSGHVALDDLTYMKFDGSGNRTAEGEKKKKRRKKKTTEGEGEEKKKKRKKRKHKEGEEGEEKKKRKKKKDTEDGGDSGEKKKKKSDEPVEPADE
eukprot:TRINITY_DN6673_c1_g1_i7.p1 TRINITY_DN6673_c1_g1~~TRINITY_DN6673_c1_g1_i7.p1  ORF type:complete len:214 (-),score=57.64 TRINITY_DN6673_c1_g1_i7:89-730(-)